MNDITVGLLLSVPFILGAILFGVSGLIAGKHQNQS